MRFENGLRLERPLVFFDLETTGVNVDTDRIVQVAVTKISPLGGPNRGLEAYVWMVNPDIPIPETASAVHGITDEDVAGLPSFGDVASDISALFVGSDVCGHNIIRFDIPLLENEMRRVGQPFRIDGGIIDTLRIFQARFRHTLECAHRLYTGEPMQGAHDAGNDVEALINVLSGMLREYPDMPNEPGELSRTPPSPDYIDAEGKFIWVSGEATFSFGAKTKGRTLKDVAKSDRGFLQWMLGQDFDESTLSIVRGALSGSFPEVT